jgi:ABC-type dipeptide/oligopeptide/nickel transport system permease subunit
MVSPQNVFEVDPSTDTPQAPVTELAAAPTKAIGRGRLILRRFMRSRSGVVGLIMLASIVTVAIVGPWLIKWSITENDFSHILTGPGIGGHILGTDSAGRDILVRTLYGLRKSLVIGLCAALITTSIAAIAGSCAGFFGKWADVGIVWIIDLLLVLPSFLILAILSPVLAGKTWLWLVLLLSIFGWMITGRVVRGMTLSLRERDYVHAARFMGVPNRTIITRHLLPNMASLLIVDVTINVSFAILAESGLSFFGFGVQPPDVSLGTVLQENQANVTAYPFTLLPACFALILTLLSVNLIGDALRDAIDPTSGASRL